MALGEDDRGRFTEDVMCCSELWSAYQSHAISPTTDGWEVEDVALPIRFCPYCGEVLPDPNWRQRSANFEIALDAAMDLMEKNRRR